MLFNSQAFLFFFLPLVLAGYYLLVPKAGRHAWLTACSYAFYAWWDWRFCGLLLLTTCVDYFAGRRVAVGRTPRQRKGWLAFSLCADLGVLGFFKYYDLGASTANALAGLFPGTFALPLLHLALPVGISFYTFQAMSYTIDIYRGEVRPARRFVDFACYVSLFPQLVAGPIVRYRDLEAQLVRREHSWEKAGAGIALFVLGLAKKVLLADGVAPLADQAFGHAAPGMAAAWTGLLAYTLQIYFDFSGYSDMAVGLGLLFGFRFPVNFDSPYKATSITDFWRRWHISLSTWLKDYLYIPLGGNRKGAGRTYFNLFATMLLGGLWHGASWMFAGWGAYHGILLAAERMNGKRGWLCRCPRPVQTGFTFLLAMGGWLLFRSENAGVAKRMACGLLGLNGWETAGAAVPDAGLHVALLVLGVVLAFCAKNTWEIKIRPTVPWCAALLALFFLSLATMLVNSSSPFLYFQF